MDIWFELIKTGVLLHVNVPAWGGNPAPARELWDDLFELGYIMRSARP